MLIASITKTIKYKMEPNNDIVQGFVRSRSILMFLISSVVPPNCFSKVFNVSSELFSKISSAFLLSGLSSSSDSESGPSLVDPEPAEKSSNVTST